MYIYILTQPDLLYTVMYKPNALFIPFHTAQLEMANYHTCLHFWLSHLAIVGVTSENSVMSSHLVVLTFRPKITLTP